MIYAVCGESLCGDEEGILEHADEAVAEQDFRAFIARRGGDAGFTSIIQRPLFRTREEAEAAIHMDDDEVDVDDSKAFRILDWERGFGFNF